MDGGEFLQTSHAPETLNGAFSSSEWQVGNLNAVVEPPARLLSFGCTKLSESGPIRCEAIRDDVLRFTVSLHQFLEEFQCRLHVSTFGDNRFRHLAFVINSPPKVMRFAVYLHEYIVQVPLPVRERAQLLDTLPSDLSSKHRANSVSPKSISIMTDFDAALMQKIFHVPQR